MKTRSTLPPFLLFFASSFHFYSILFQWEVVGFVQMGMIGCRELREFYLSSIYKRFTSIHFAFSLCRYALCLVSLFISRPEESLADLYARDAAELPTCSELASQRLQS